MHTDTFRPTSRLYPKCCKCTTPLAAHRLYSPRTILTTTTTSWPVTSSPTTKSYIYYKSSTTTLVKCPYHHYCLWCSRYGGENREEIRDDTKRDARTSPRCQTIHKRCSWRLRARDDGRNIRDKSNYLLFAANEIAEDIKSIYIYIRLEINIIS